MAKTQKIIKIQQIASPIRRDGRQRLYLKSLGLRKINHVRELQKTPGVEALVKKMPHLVKVIG